MNNMPLFKNAVVSGATSLQDSQQKRMTIDNKAPKVSSFARQDTIHTENAQKTFQGMRAND